MLKNANARQVTQGAQGSHIVVRDDKTPRCSPESDIDVVRKRKHWQHILHMITACREAYVAVVVNSTNVIAALKRITLLEPHQYERAQQCWPFSTKVVVRLV